MELILLIRERRVGRVRLSSRFLLKMLISYLLVALIPMLFMISSYIGSIRNSEEMERERLAAAVDKACVAINGDAEKLISIFQAILSDDTITGVSRRRNPLIDKRNVYPVLAAQKQLSVIGLCGGLFDEIFIYNEAGDYLLSTESIYLKPELMSAALRLRYRNAGWPDKLLPIIRDNNGYDAKWLMLSDDVRGNAALVCMQRIYTGFIHTQSCIAVLISPETLGRYLPESENVSMALVDSQGALVAGSMPRALNMAALIESPDQQAMSGADGSSYMTYTRTTACAGLRLMAAMPYSVIQADTAALRNSFLIMAMTVLMTTLALCLGFAIINTRPIDHILKMLFGVPAVGLPHHMENWRTLDQSIQRLISDNYELKRSIKLQTDYMKANLYYELLTDWQGDATERILPRLREMKLAIEGAFILITMHFRTTSRPDNQPAISLALHAFVNDAFPMAFHIAETGEQRFAVFVPLSEWDGLEERLTGIKARAQDMLCMTLVCAFDRMPDMTGIGRVSWEQARTIELLSGDGVPEPVQGSGDDAWPAGVYPGRLDTMLTSAIVSGDARQLKSALERFRDSVCARGDISGDQLRLHMDHLRMTIGQAICRCVNVDTALALSALHLLKHYNRLDSTAEQLSQISAALEPIICREAQQAGTSLRKARITADILDFIRGHFRDADMCLGLLAEHFHMDEGYISQLIRQETDMSFQAYVESLRIERACELLRQHRKVKDVAEEVGYSSTGNFRRAFTKVTGSTPSAYSESSPLRPAQ